MTMGIGMTVEFSAMRTLDEVGSFFPENAGMTVILNEDVCHLIGGEGPVTRGIRF